MYLTLTRLLFIKPGFHFGDFLIVSIKTLSSSLWRLFTTLISTTFPVESTINETNETPVIPLERFHMAI